MNLAVSNIAWTNEEELDIAILLQEKGVKYVEIAPTKLWQDPTVVAVKEAKKYVDWWAGYGVEVKAFQSILFARSDLKLFESDQNRQECLEYMLRFLELAVTMGAERLVFGSPKNRQRSSMTLNQATAIAIDFFGVLGKKAEQLGVVLCLEPNAPQYGCDFITTASEGAALVKTVNSKGFGLHLDTACMTLAGDDMAKSILSYKNLLRHFHVSAPMLGAVGAEDGIDHTAAANALTEAKYEGLVSIEMRPANAGENVTRIKAAIEFVQNTYGIV